jgi:hypothetical protein
LSWIDKIFKKYRTKRIDELLTKYRKKNSERESFKKVKLRKTREKEREKSWSDVHFHPHHLSTFRIFPHSKFGLHTKLKSSLFEDELRKLRISSTFKSLIISIFVIKCLSEKNLVKQNLLLYHFFLWWYLLQENFCKDKGNLFYVPITFWMMLMCKKVVWILKNPLILFENSGKNEFNFSFSQRTKCPLRWSMNNKEISSLILVDNSNFDLNRKSSKTNSQHNYPILSYAISSSFLH